ncbi:TetR/AcrR family transcriptional regulator [Mycolicibacterium septicum]|uniref:TetR/AcrR family transcriptional regulator n=1 Tax=Mycolicibacterium septicum TaxID=98668 RepID=UPI00235E7825|nr:TetR/AcrR family transcriptional regulator [Mycolicibacterium septicum]
MKASAAPTRPPSGSQPRADLTRAKILDEAVAHVLEKGLAGASVKAIAQRAGVTWGVVQYHFGDRDALLAAVVDKSFDELFEALATAPIQHDSGASLAERVQLIIDTAWSVMSSPTCRAATEILIATRPARGSAARKQLSRLAAAFDVLALAIADDLDADTGKAVSHLLLANLRGLITTQLIMPGTVDTGPDRRLLAEVIARYIETTAAERSRSTGSGS